MTYNDVTGETDAVPHQFKFAGPEQVSGGEHVSEAIAMLFPKLRAVFTVAKYTKGTATLTSFWTVSRSLFSPPTHTLRAPRAISTSCPC